MQSMTKFDGGGKIPAARLRVGIVSSNGGKIPATRLRDEIALSNGGKIPATRLRDEVRGGEIPANF